MNLLILAANGQIARIVEDRILKEKKFEDVRLTLGLRHADRLSALKDNPRVTLLETDLDNTTEVNNAMVGQDMVFTAVVDHDANNTMTKNVIAAAKANGTTRIISTSVLGIYDEVPGEFGRWNHQMIASGLPTAINADKLLAQSGITYTTLRLPWLNDRDEVKYAITTRHEPFNGVSGSRQSIADVVLRIVVDPAFAANESIGIADPATQGEDRPVY
ncbi:NAD(P)H-binding protein [Schleiferilactobacillus harbinensis]|uniref:NAD(P)H-binding protein n=1 Tax=Schleiferilactobacillus harbinensis TaxID=304207 RepID=UPI0024307E99|nr:NAD(P)H-binding protein [Schleiferilactobacillus harbinensis]MCI1686850.1 NAD(P)H-binding protein [Schleiferilactobacillus harbinensis]MCI1783727.1 NAD(P)H-binding protein [Schleiferilactobacillus harbinensis]MCI1850521.1 NAD(P)H-binding protein [Schleiferilactobacillus harbinensis]